MFKSKNTNHSTTELVVVVTPTVVDPLSDTAVPAQPDLPIPTLKPADYDKSLGKDANPHPAAPPLDPDHPPFGGGPVPPAVPTASPSLAPANGAAQDIAPPVAPVVSPSVIASDSVVATDTYTPAQGVPSLPVTATTQLSAPMAPANPEPTAIAPQLVASASEVRPILPPDLPGATANTNAPAPEAGDAPERAIVEVMTLSHEADADAMVAALKRHGYDVAVNRDPHDSLLHLDVGPFSSKAAAETMRQRLLLDGYDATIKKSS